MGKHSQFLISSYAQTVWESCQFYLQKCNLNPFTLVVSTHAVQGPLHLSFLTGLLPSILIPLESILYPFCTFLNLD